jgi:NAD(P)-dependent dehydrogenase (short-subunit alcohol dehydrogenase family)
MPTVNISMQGKICMVTGANSGIGKATVLALAQMGATVVMVCRDRARGEEAKSEITTKSRNNARRCGAGDSGSAGPRSPPCRPCRGGRESDPPVRHQRLADLPRRCCEMKDEATRQERSTS